MMKPLRMHPMYLVGIMLFAESLYLLIGIYHDTISMIVETKYLIMAAGAGIIIGPPLMFYGTHEIRKYTANTKGQEERCNKQER